ncbi:hypothetical protein B0H16DRAFT_1893081 [Mycena metata]|uniref:F-box domain-containing protein n=1 Tax=Mycena metata TaxID=1033252 RepID=A0AAD7I0Q8_9AGAR|nr:hypothetical protein B0H16DRAFT_1893081 [Mycena metata]
MIATSAIDHNNFRDAVLSLVVFHLAGIWRFSVVGMHRCLEVPELVGLVCSHLQGPRQLEIAFDVGHPKRGDLAVLARTSTVFSSHALRLIWESATLKNLLGCLPPDSFKLTTTGEGYFTKYIMQLLRPLQSSDFERVRIYAPRVKHLFSDPKSADLSSSLHWWHDEDNFQYIHCFLILQLTKIHIPHASPAALTLLPSLAHRCPQLTNLLFFPRGALDLGSLAVFAVSACVRGLDGIESLTVDMLNHAAFKHLSRLPSLRHLRLGELASTLDDEPSFPSLQTLYFSSKIASPSRFLEWANKFPLVEFTAECPAFSTADEVHRLFSAAAGGITHSSLTEFIFDNEFGSLNDASDGGDYLIRSSSLRRLFCFTNLTTVSILSAFGIDLDDATITDMARSWRQIECLEFQSYYGTPAPRATLQCLAAFPKYCPHLTKLSIAFDATAIPTAHGDLSLEGLKRLDVEPSPIAAARPVAHFIARIFPGLTHITTLADSLDGDPDWEADVGPQALQYDRHWKEVAAICAPIK